MSDKLLSGFQVPQRTDHAIKWGDAGQLMAVFCIDERYGKMHAKDLYARLLPAISSGQYAIGHKLIDAEIAGGQINAPVASVLWARVSDKLHSRLKAMKEIPYLTPVEWDSGPNHWIIDAAGEIDACGKLIDRLHREQFGKQPFHAFMNLGDGKVQVRGFGTG